MKITYSEGVFGKTATVYVARQTDLNKTNVRVDELSESMENVNKRLKAVEKRLARVEKLLASVDTRLRDDCRDIFTDVICDALSPAFAAMGRSVTGKCAKSTPAIETGRAASKAGGMDMSLVRVARAAVAEKRTRVKKIAK